MITNKFQKKAYDAVAAALPFKIDAGKITVDPGKSYLPSPIKLSLRVAAGLDFPKLQRVSELTLANPGHGRIVDRLDVDAVIGKQQIARRLAQLRIADIDRHDVAAGTLKRRWSS
jgi:hypothetical protein